MIKKETKESIERICKVFIASLPGSSGLEDSITLKNFLDSTFMELTERMYAYRICHDIIKEQVKQNEGVEDNSNQRESGER